MTTMSKSQMYLHFLLLVLLCCVTSSSFLTIHLSFNSPITGLVACPRHQIQALIDFKSEFDTHQCNHSDPFNLVLCDKETSAITVLRLRACLSGTLKLNSSFFSMHHLRYLHLSQKNFASSSLPSELGNLNRLDLLSLSNNGFIGQVPSSFSNRNHLSGLNLSNNEFTGSFPLVQNLTKLVVLDLSHNHFSGTLNPNSNLFELHHLCYLDLSFNNFRSSLPTEFGNLNRLESLDLSSNEFFSQVPPTISNLTKLNLLSLDHNKLTGSFQFLQNLTDIFVLTLYDNHFSRNIPFSLLNMPFLSYIDMCGNKLSGSIGSPNSSSSSNLETMLLGNNHFERQILEPISKLINLQYLDVSFLNTSYPIDISMFSCLKYLVYLDLSGNSIPPASLKTYSYIPPNLKTLFLSSCGINEFPIILKTLKNLEFIKLSHNKIKGKVPDWLWSLPHLSFVSIANNSFDGFKGPVEVLVNISLKALDLQQNCFTGAIPILPLSINLLDADENKFTGIIPLSICNCNSLTDLALAKNNLT